MKNFFTDIGNETEIKERIKKIMGNDPELIMDIVWDYLKLLEIARNEKLLKSPATVGQFNSN